jgi:hypothetical protein
VPIGEPPSRYRRRMPMSFQRTDLGAALVMDYLDPGEEK